jgi:WD40 repeat protein
MLVELNGKRVERESGQGVPLRSEGRPVRLALLTWPVIVLVGATVAAATCLLSDCDRFERTLAKETLVGDVGSVKSIAYRPDGAMLSSLGVDGSIVIWDLAARPHSAFIPQGIGMVRCAAFSPDNRLLATGNARATVSLHDLDDDHSRSLFDTPAATSDAGCVAFSADGATLAVGQEDGKITLWDAATGRRRSTLSGHTEFVASMVFASDGTTLASSGSDRVTRIWDLSAGSELYAITSLMNPYMALAFSPDGRLLALGDHVSAVVRLWDLTAGAERAALRGPTGAVVGVAISPDGTTLAAADYQGVVTFWDLANLEMRPRRLRHPGVRSLAFAPDGRALATGGFDGTIHLWAFPLASGDRNLASAVTGPG